VTFMQYVWLMFTAVVDHIAAIYQMFDRNDDKYAMYEHGYIHHGL